MGILRPETVRLIAQEMFDYELSAETARWLAHGAGALLTNSHHLSTVFNLAGLEPPFGYPNLEAEAARIRAGKP